jgi:CheY-like chemotaxis protein
LLAQRGHREEVTFDGLKDVCVMVAEDNTTNRDVLKMLLEQKGRCRVIEANNGVDALDKLTDEVQVVLMDVSMLHLRRLHTLCPSLWRLEAFALNRRDLVRRSCAAPTASSCVVTQPFSSLLRPALESLASLMWQLCSIVDETFRVHLPDTARGFVLLLSHSFSPVNKRDISFTRCDTCFL